MSSMSSCWSRHDDDHPIHLHGMWSDVEDEHGNFAPRKHTVDMPPRSKRSNGWSKPNCMARTTHVAVSARASTRSRRGYDCAMSSPASAPYIGVVWERAYAGTADFRRDEGEEIDETRFLAGLRIWF